MQRHHWHCWLCSSYRHNITSSGSPPVFHECTSLLLILACHSYVIHCMSGFSESMQDASQLLRATVQQKGYHSVTIDGKEAQVTFHSFSQNNTTNCSKRKMWIRAIRCGIGRHWQPGRWTKVNPLHLKPTDFYNYWSGYRTLKENVVPSIFPFDSQSRVADDEVAQAAQSSHSTCQGWSPSSC